MEEETHYMLEKPRVITPNPAHVNISAGGVAKYANNKMKQLNFLNI